MINLVIDNLSIFKSKTKIKSYAKKNISMIINNISLLKLQNVYKIVNL